MADEIIFEDGENYQNKEVGIKEIAMEQYKRCAFEGSKNIYSNPQQREIYINAVKSMEIIMWPDFLEDYHKDLRTEFVANERKIEDIKKEYEAHRKSLINKYKDQPLNLDRLSHEYEMRLVELYQEKLVMIGRLLKRLNYYGEFSISS